MTTALAAAVASGDMFTMLAVDHIQKEGTAKPTAEHLRRPDFEPANRKQMLETPVSYTHLTLPTNREV